MIVKDESRRSALRKGAAFIIPAVATFKLGELKVAASQGSPTGGNHYGNDTPDQNPGDNSQWNDPGGNTGPNNP